ncbi:MAG: DNA-3-methyladenine glycosylase I [Nitrospiraceae bacterium]
MEVKRCPWARTDLNIVYHDTELFEFLILEGAQAGLSWSTILKKRDNYREAFKHFDPEKVAKSNQRTIERLLTNPGIVRNRMKIEAAVQNAKAFLALQKEFGSFDTYVWRFIGGRPKKNAWRAMNQIPSRSPESDALSTDLARRGFKFVGSTICYAFMQAVGMVNDHVVDCFRYGEIR